MIPLNRRTLFGLMAAASAPLPALAGAKVVAEPLDMTAPGYAARIDYPPAPAHEAVVDPADHHFPV